MKKMKTLHYLIAGLCILFFVIACPANSPPAEGWIEVHNDTDYEYQVMINEEAKMVGPGGTVTFTVTFSSGETSKDVTVYYRMNLDGAFSPGFVVAEKGETVLFYI
jgi:hypothetical protein